MSTVPTATLIIPTYNRPREIVACLKSILKQSRLPDEVIIVDDGALPEPPQEKEIRQAGIRYHYVRKNKPGLTESRNKGVELSTGDVVFFLDDDVVLDPQYVAEILKIYQQDALSEVGGVGGCILNHPPRNWKARIRNGFEALFLVSGFREGRVLPSGFCVDYGRVAPTAGERIDVDFLSGGVMSFRKEIFDQFRFTDSYRAFGFGEDKDFSFRVRKKLRLVLALRAGLYHYPAPAMRPHKHREGRMFLVGRYLFFTRFKPFWKPPVTGCLSR